MTATPNAAFFQAYAQVYNDWAYEIFGAYPNRFVPAAVIPTVDPTFAIAEIQRVAKLGFKTVFLPARTPTADYNNKIFDPMWEAIQEIGLPVSFHAGTGWDPFGFGPGATVIGHVWNSQGDGARLVVYLVSSGIMERYPEIHFVMVETGASWMTWVLSSMDQYVEKKGVRETNLFPVLKEKPSEYWRRRGHCTFQDDVMAVVNRHYTGLETLIWGNDYPHPEGTWPRSQEYLRDQLDGVPEDEVRAIVGGTAAKIYGLELK
jgi:predicted TIM-barrel fold metal-dependent hydrolase